MAAAVTLIHDAGEGLDPCDEHGAQEVAHPDDQQVQQVPRPGVFKQVAGLACKQRIAPGTDGKQADGKQQSPHHIAPREGIPQPQKYRTPQADAEAGQDGKEEQSSHTSHIVFLPLRRQPGLSIGLARSGCRGR